MRFADGEIKNNKKIAKSLIILILRYLCYRRSDSGRISELSSTTLSNDVLADKLIKNKLHPFFSHNLPEVQFKDFVEERENNGHLFPHETVSRK